MSELRIDRDEEGQIIAKRNKTHASVLQALSDADFAPQGSLDLHGLRSEQAREKIRGFIQEGARRRVRYVLIIVGKGRNSAQPGGVLGDAAVLELSRGPSQVFVEAFRSAPRHCGGSGALAVCLKALPKKQEPKAH